MLQLVGCNHRVANTRLREQLSVPAARLPDALTLFRERFPKSEGVLLSTCNRTELYTAAVDVEHLPSNADLAAYLAELNGMEGAEVFDHLFHTTGEEAVRHLFTVAASLDSMVVGETQILSQVKQAYQLATAGANTGVMTHAAFQAAIRVAKRVARETTIQQRRVSIASVAIRELAKQVFERFEDKHILVIGAGETAQEALRCLREEGASTFSIVNRNPDRALQLACQFGGNAASFDQLGDLLIAADLVISATGATVPVVTRNDYDRIAPNRFQRTQFILDLAVPRDFEAEIGDELGVYLYTIDDLKAVCEQNLKQREREMPMAYGIIEEETDLFMHDLMHRSTAPTIRRLRNHADQVKADEVKRLFRKLGELDEVQQAEIARSFDRFVNKLLHPPLESLKEEKSASTKASLLEAIRRLFQLHD